MNADTPYEYPVSEIVTDHQQMPKVKKPSAIPEMNARNNSPTNAKRFSSSYGK
jgi:hypothetical protein